MIFALMQFMAAVCFAQNYVSSPFLPAENRAPSSDFSFTDYVNEKFSHGAGRINISWGGGTSQHWTGEVKLSEGEFKNLTILGMEPDVPGSIWLDKGDIKFQTISPKFFSGIHVTVDASPSAHIQFRTIDPVKKMEHVRTFQVSDVLASRQQQNLDDSGNIVIMERIPGDELSVHLPDGKTVLQPGSPFHLEVLPRFVAFPWEKGLVLTTSVYRCRSEERLMETEHIIPEPTEASSKSPISVTVNLPQEEGAFDVVLRVLRKTDAGFMKPAKNEILSQRTIQCYLISQNMTTPISGPIKLDYRESLVESIDTHNPTWWQRFAKIPVLPKVGNPSLGHSLGKIPSFSFNIWERGMNNWQESLSSGDIEPYKGDERYSNFSQLKPSTDPSKTPWEVFIIPVKEPGKPHFVEIDYISNLPQTLGVSIVEPGANGGISANSIDSGIHIMEKAVSDDVDGRILQHRILFWPKTTDPMILLTNRQSNKPAVFGGIRVYRAPDEFPRSMTSHPANNQRRLFAAYYHRPTFCENFSAGGVLGTGDHSQMEVSDWKTFHDGIERMVQYLRMVGYGGGMISVASDGSALYPSEHLVPTPRYDTGVFMPSGEDPVRKDVLEVIATRFDEENLVFIPAIDFSTPLIALEQRIRDNYASGQLPEETGLTWIGINGKSLTEYMGTNFGRAPYYNILNPHVQDAMLEVIRELIKRSASHPSFGGISIQLNPDGYAMLPEEYWGLDDHTFGRFVRERRLDIRQRGNDRFAERAELLQKTHMEAWLSWRAEQVELFYKKVKNLLVEARPDAKLYLAGAKMFDSPKFQRMFTPSLTNNDPNITWAMRTLGFSLSSGFGPSFFHEDRSVVFLRPEKIVGNGALAESAVSMELAWGNIAWFFAMPGNLPHQMGSSKGSLFYHSVLEGGLEDFERVCPFQPAKTWFYTEPTPSEHQNRARFVAHLAECDTFNMFDGGRMLPMGQEDAVRDLISQFQMLPQIPFETFDAPGQTTQPITLRFVNTDHGTYCYLINTASFHVPVKIDFKSQPGSHIEHSAFRTFNPLQNIHAGFRWTETVRPYDLIVLRISDPKAKPQNMEVLLPAEICGPKGKIQKKIDDMSERIRYARGGVPWDILSNPDFELSAISHLNTTKPQTSPRGLNTSLPAFGTIFQNHANTTGESTQPHQEQPIPGWNIVGNTVQVQVDSKIAKSGKSSLKLVSKDKEVGGVQSEFFTIPKTGSLFVSVWVGIPENATDLPLKLTLYGKQPSRNPPSASIGPWIWNKISQVPPENGVRWFQVLVPFKGLQNQSGGPVQIHFEMFDTGVVWIDHVQLYQFVLIDEAEIWTLLRFMAVTNTHLNNNKISQAINVLESYWPRLLEECIPDIEAVKQQNSLLSTMENKKDETPVSTHEQKDTDQQSKDQETPSGILGRVRQWIPSWR